MASRRPSIRLTAPSFLLAAALVCGSAAPAIARDTSVSGAFALGGGTSRTIPRVDRVAPKSPAATVRQPVEVRPPTPDVPVAKPVAVSRSAAKPDTTTHTAQTTTAFRGRNHLWIPTLRIDRSVAAFSCSSQAYPGNRVYRWGCAGSNNVYLFGHASSVFAPLHDAYVAGRLHKGMAVYYADGAGRVHRYTVRWWKVTTPDDGAWAYASQSRPSLTLQTCVGARSQFRLIVRLVRSD